MANSSGKHSEERAWLSRHFDLYRSAMFQTDIVDSLLDFRDRLLACRKRGKKVIMAGNGGSAAMASHCAVDFTKTAGIRCVNFNEADLITCFANDYGYAQWLQKALEFYADPGDLVVLISSSGQSANMVQAARHAKTHGFEVVTFTGFKPNNPLKETGSLNFWVESRVYNVVEMTHHVWLLAVCDLLAEARQPRTKVRIAAEARA